MEDIKIANFDEDIKIAGSKSSKRSAEDEVKDTFDELLRAKNDGNLNAITELGIKTARYIMPGEHSFVTETNDRGYGLQKRWLCIFAAMIGFERATPSALLAKAAFNTMYQTLEKDFSEIFVGSGYSTAMSFYYLAVRSSFKVEEEIGGTFAMLCGKGTDKGIANEGKDLFVRFVEFVESEVEAILK